MAKIPTGLRPIDEEHRTTYRVHGHSFDNLKEAMIYQTALKIFDTIQEFDDTEDMFQAILWLVANPNFVEAEWSSHVERLKEAGL